MMIKLDCHVHVSAFAAGHGSMSPQLLGSIPFTFMRWRFGLQGSDQTTERQVEDLLVHTVDQTPELDGAVVLAMDAVHDRDGRADWANTHLYVSNDYVIELAARHPRLLFAASVHPYRADAVAELQRCATAGAVMIKWLPITQNFNPADSRCIPFYEALAHLGIPLLSHTGSEHALPNLDRAVADPMLLMEAARRGVTLIAAHCGSRLFPWEIDYVPNWARMARQFENFYGDTAALNVPGRWYAFDTILSDPLLRSRLVHGSDWPIPALPPPNRIGWEASWKIWKEQNWLRRDVLIKRKLGLEEDYWHRAATLLKIDSKKKAGLGSPRDPRPL
jgi:predicted TIM-barrel fold metal-dependent hydrolase